MKLDKNPILEKASNLYSSVHDAYEYFHKKSRGDIIMPDREEEFGLIQTAIESQEEMGKLLEEIRGTRFCGYKGRRECITYIQNRIPNMKDWMAYLNENQINSKSC